MQNITVGRYQHPTTRQYWQGWIEPEDRSWIMFIDANGAPTVYLDHEDDGGIRSLDHFSVEMRRDPDVLIREREDDPIE